MSSAAAYRWGRMIARRRRMVLGAWVLVLIACAASYPGLKRSLGAPNYGIDGAESSRAAQLLEQRFAAHGAEQDVLVFDSPVHRAGEPAYRAVVARALLTARRQGYVKGVAGPYDRGARGQISRDGHAAIALVGIAGDPRQLVERATLLQEAVDPLAAAGVHVWLTGYSPVAKDITTVENGDVERAETIGVPIALLVLLLALGAAAAAIVPLAIAGSGLLLTFGLLAVLATMLTFDSFLTTIVTMIGVGIGIDYALFIVSRFREELARRRGDPDQPVGSEQIEEAVGAAISSSGRTVLFSGVVVALALATLVVIRAPIYHEFALGAVAVVVCTVIVALTLLPAVLALLGPRIDRGALPARMQPRDARPGASDGHGVWARWALAVMRHPVLAAGTIAAVLLLAATPLLGLRTGVDFGIASLSGTPSGKGERVLARSFGAGALAPIEIVIAGRGGSGPLDRTETARAAVLARELAPTAHNDVAAIVATPGRDAELLTVAPATAIDSYRSEQLVRHIRSTLLPAIRAGGGLEVAVGGATAKIVDLSNETRAKVPLVLGLILALSLMFLTVVFRSVVLPVKAVAMNLLATGATVGIVIFVFQEGHGEHLLGFTSTGFIQVFLPLSIFALLFGLSMDYEVFLIRRMRETWLQTHDNELAVATGVEHTARPITAAAAIMVAVFGSFITANVLELKQFGLGLALAIAIDATLIRFILVPALMRLFGARNWWLPNLRQDSPAPARDVASESAGQ
ncbi:MAG TPA: efflux RND transporter permease subunit [Solirubrobacteraceae bacterium]|jgi:RND superfamily putative drug exporter|nr:efflux RND transporter permease subunit [Solirubrobacteraceae bacterium]